MEETHMQYVKLYLTEEQNAGLERIKELLEEMNQGPYGGTRGRSVSKGEAVKYMVNQIEAALIDHVERVQQKKRAEARAKRQNNNPGVVPGVSRNKTQIYNSSNNR
jgi:hypothetical protein